MPLPMRSSILAVVHLQDAQARALQATTSAVCGRDTAHVPRRKRSHDVPVLEGEVNCNPSLKRSPEHFCGHRRLVP
jgi:hypothetical protein